MISVDIKNSLIVKSHVHTCWILTYSTFIIHMQISFTFFCLKYKVLFPYHPGCAV